MLYDGIYNIPVILDDLLCRVSTQLEIEGLIRDLDVLYKLLKRLEFGPKSITALKEPEYLNICDELTSYLGEYEISEYVYKDDFSQVLSDKYIRQAYVGKITKAYNYVGFDTLERLERLVSLLKNFNKNNKRKCYWIVKEFHCRQLRNNINWSDDIVCKKCRYSPTYEGGDD